MRSDVMLARTFFSGSILVAALAATGCSGGAEPDGGEEGTTSSEVRGDSLERPRKCTTPQCMNYCSRKLPHGDPGRDKCVYDCVGGTECHSE